MRVLNLSEIEQVSGGSKKWDKISEGARALPGTDVTLPLSLSGKRTGWCRGYGNVKDGVPTHAQTGFPCPGVPS
jgi:hypothetical protein